MASIVDGTKVPPHGIFYMESVGGAEAATVAAIEPVAGDEFRPSCFALEEEQGETWSGAGASRPPIRDTRPTL